MPWVQVKTPIKFTPGDKEKITKIANDIIQNSPRLKNMFTRLVLRSGRLYIYKSFLSAEDSDGNKIDVPEYIYLRISIYNKDYTDCSIDYQSHHGFWVILDEGTLEECLQKPDNGLMI